MKVAVKAVPVAEAATVAGKVEAEAIAADKAAVAEATEVAEVEAEAATVEVVAAVDREEAMAEVEAVVTTKTAIVNQDINRCLISHSSKKVRIALFFISGHVLTCIFKSPGNDLNCCFCH